MSTAISSLNENLDARSSHWQAHAGTAAAAAAAAGCVKAAAAAAAG